MRPAWIPVLILLISSGACRRSEIVRGVSDSTFVRTMVELRRLPTGLFSDTTFRARMRDSVLRANRVTGDQMESAAVRLAQDPVRAAAIWQAIEHAGSTAPGR